MEKSKLNLIVDEDLWQAFKDLTPRDIKLNDRVCDLIQKEVKSKLPVDETGQDVHPKPTAQEVPA
ncbi:MAG: hypothetical protein QGF25_06915 [Candidatus Woesearchaeota archaeon]|jgi:hypothetical protein|nr:hypothetical protein [Candidatus Woesearchaeota archaeon]